MKSQGMGKGEIRSGTDLEGNVESDVYTGREGESRLIPGAHQFTGGGQESSEREREIDVSITLCIYWFRGPTLKQKLQKTMSEKKLKREMQPGG